MWIDLIEGLRMVCILYHCIKSVFCSTLIQLNEIYEENCSFDVDIIQNSAKISSTICWNNTLVPKKLLREKRKQKDLGFFRLIFANLLMISIRLREKMVKNVQRRTTFSHNVLSTIFCGNMH